MTLIRYEDAVQKKEVVVQVLIIDKNMWMA